MSDLSSGKGHQDENFPVASVLIAPRHRPAVMAFYAVARMADDIADHETVSPEEKLARLAAIEATLVGRVAADHVWFRYPAASPVSPTRHSGKSASRPKAPGCYTHPD